ncbi:MAG: FG-GAP-like repeat-containing protein, partial [Bacteroidales bacterium]|nr:FG-GAP-like repeat-containing protein [Bacteroidales bacterium]
MKKVLLLLIVVALSKLLVAQAPNVTSIEYFIDSDPGFENGTPVSLAPDSIINLNFDVDVSGLSIGNHRLFVRTKDETGKWSLTYKQDIFKSNQTATVSEPLKDIVVMEYYFDVDPGLGNGTPISFTSDSIIDININADVSGLTLGNHRFYVRTKDETGKWSLTYKQDIYKSDQNPAVPEPLKDIVAMEYYFDIDPGFGNGTPATFSADSIIDPNFDVDVSGLSFGNHRLFIRTKDETEQWSLTYKQDVYKSDQTATVKEPLKDIIASEYYFGSDPGFGNASPITINQDSIIEVSFFAELDSLDYGINWFNVRVKDEEGKWSLNLIDSINILIRAGFNISDTLELINNSVQFTDFSTSNVTSWQWDFENDGIIDDVTQNPTWSFNSLGTYSVKFIVSDGINTDSIIKENLIEISDHLGFTQILVGDIVNNGGNSMGCSWGDYDNDGCLDLFVPNLGDQNNFLYHNQGDGTFIRITEGNIVNDGGDSRSNSWSDFDNDGDLDLFVTNWDQNNFLYNNQGNGTFLRITEGNIVNDGGNSEGASWVDYDNDGYLDLFVANDDQNNFLYHNNGNGTFTKVLNGSIVNDGGRSHGIGWTDYDNDGLLDLYVVNAVGESNFLYRNNGNGTFTSITEGQIVNDGGDCSGCSWSDFNNDGFLDVFVANRWGQNNFLYRNEGDGSFTKITDGLIVTEGGHSAGSSWGDYNNDGYIDLHVSNMDNNDNFLYRNNGDGTFDKITTGKIVNEGEQARGTSWGDYNNDGHLDLFVANSTEHNNILFQNNGSNNSWIDIKCLGIASNTSAVGTKVRVKAVINEIPTWQVQEISGQTGFMSQKGLRAEFGLGNATIIDSLIIEWPSGIEFDTINVSINQFLTIVEDSTQYKGPGPVVINEVMINPTAVNDLFGEWFEVHNISDSAVDLNGWTIKDLDFDSHTINSSVIVPPGQYCIFGIDGNISQNGGVQVDYVYSAIFFSNTAPDELLLIAPNLDTVDMVVWDAGLCFPNPIGSSIELINPFLNNNVGINWIAATLPFGQGDNGTPGMVNLPYAPKIHIPDSLYFSPVAIAQTDTAFATIRNSGVSNLVIDTIITNLQDYDVDQYQFTIPPSDSTEVKVLFTPSQSGLIRD